MPAASIPPSNRTLAWMCAVLGCIGIAAMAVLTPPLQAGDEPQHLYRAYQISEGHLWSRARGGIAGFDVPSALPELTDRFLGTRDNHEGPVSDQPLARTLQELRRPLDPDRREFVDFTGAATYSPLAYLPQVAAIAAGRRAGLGPLGLLYAARFANGAVALTLLVLAVALTPVGAAPMLAAGLLPMALIQYGSATPDAAIFGTAFLFTALALRSAAAGRWTAARFVAAAACGCVLCAAKPVYAPLLLTGLVWRPLRRTPPATAWGSLAIAVVVLAVTLAWLRSTAGVLLLWNPQADLARQLAGIVHDPLRYAGVLARSLWLDGFYYQGMVGVLGWAPTWLPAPAYWLPPAAAAVTLLLPRPPGLRPAPAAIAWHLVLIAGCVVLAMTALYLYWTDVGLDHVVGVQGRYFIPMLPLAVALAAATLPAPRRPIRTGTGLIALAALVLAQFAVTAISTVRLFAVFGR